MKKLLEIWIFQYIIILQIFVVLKVIMNSRILKFNMNSYYKIWNLAIPLKKHLMIWNIWYIRTLNVIFEICLTIQIQKINIEQNHNTQDNQMNIQKQYFKVKQIKRLLDGKKIKFLMMWTRNYSYMNMTINKICLTISNLILILIRTILFKVNNSNIINILRSKQIDE